MKAKRYGRIRVVARLSAIALLAGALAFVATVHHDHSVRPHRVTLTAATDFSITGTITEWPTCPGVPTASLYPGTHRCLTYTVQNPKQVAISVLSLSTAIDSTVATTVPSACTLDLGDATLSGTQAVPVTTVPAGGTNTASAPITLTDNGQNQDVCKGFTFPLVYSGTATYTEIYSTSTGVASSVNPSNVGQSVTYTATVTGLVGSGQDPLPNSPTGTVDFKDGASTICSHVAVSSASTTTSTAQCTPTPAYSTAGTHPITAVFTHAADLNFADSTSSPVLNQVVQAVLPGTSTALTSTPNPSLVGTPVSMTATVSKSSGSGTPSGTVTFFSGTPSGTHLPLGTGPLNAGGVATFATSNLPAGADNLYAVYGGNASFAGSASPVISQIVIAQPAACTGTYTLIVGNPASPVVHGTNGNDFIYAVGGNFTVDGQNGNDCIQTGDGNNTITDGNGDDVIMVGNGTNTITAGNGTVTITAGNGSNTITAGNGSNTITVGNGSTNKLAVGNGNNTITFGTGASNIATAGNGNNTFRIQTPGNHDTLTAGNGKNVAFLGGGTFNKFTGGKAGSVCHLPSLPASSFSDTLTNCTAVTP